MSGRDVTIEWASWLETIQSDDSTLSNRLDEIFELTPLNDEAELQAIKHALQSHQEQVLFLEGQDDDATRGMVAYRLNNEWNIRSLPAEVEQDVLSEFLHYTMSVLDCLEGSRSDSDYGDYYSLSPLVYGGRYWLDTVCRQEFDRYQDLKETGVLSVIVIPWEESWSLFDLVDELRRGDRVGYFEDLLGIALPFTDDSQMVAVAERLKESFDINKAYCWQVEKDFENLHELSTKVKELL